MPNKFILVLLFCCTGSWTTIEGKLILLRPIPKENFKHIPNKAHLEDAIPTGRVFSYGLLALKGLTLGFRKGAANILNGLGSINKPTINYNGGEDEICFTSKSSSSDIIESDYNADRAQFRQSPPSPPSPPSTPTGTTPPGTTTTTTTTTTPAPPITSMPTTTSVPSPNFCIVIKKSK